eukprot:1155601-Pelagomonas_calceolata.AAC.1
MPSGARAQACSVRQESQEVRALGEVQQSTQGVAARIQTHYTEGWPQEYKYAIQRGGRKNTNALYRGVAAR